jgi:hypothetical protein
MPGLYLDKGIRQRLELGFTTYEDRSAAGIRSFSIGSRTSDQ